MELWRNKMNTEIIEMLTKLASEETLYETGAELCDVAPNPEDAYGLGIDDGYIGLARKILKMLELKNEQDNHPEAIC
jgi:hypothetical protein